jgi:hypothetical protein
LNRYQTITEDEQGDVLELLDKARKIIERSHDGKDNNLENRKLVAMISNIFHEVQLASTEEL